MLPGMLRRLFSQSVSTETMDSDTPLKDPDFIMNSPYYHRISTLHHNFPHLQSLSLYMHAIESARSDGLLGSHDSDSILAAEILKTGEISYNQIDCYNPADVESHSDILCGKGDKQTVSARIIVIEDLSPAAIEVLGTRFHLDPHMFYFHLGFDTKRSAMANLVDASNENKIPVTWCMPRHFPENFISVPMPCDLKPMSALKLESGLKEDLTYSRQAHRQIAQIPGKEREWDPPQRAFHRISLIFPKTDIL
ncbi:hypothetical protein VF21_07382 [Pseudogymnoascus sp. 05NY08]|nr:hypothetical protein VF21_07382 [Pseudogymnoascus sp. 05NY08]